MVSFRLAPFRSPFVIPVRARVPFLHGGGDETRRVRRHFDAVLRELRSRDTSRLSRRLSKARAKNLDRLQAYADRGAFPRNEGFPGLLVPYFIDRAGTTCAVAQLLIDSGLRPLAERIAASQNNLAVDVMQSEELAAWIGESGLSPAECVRVQPGYCCGRMEGFGDGFYDDEQDAGKDAGKPPWEQVGGGFPTNASSAQGSGGYGGAGSTAGTGGAAGSASQSSGGGVGGSAGAGGTAGAGGSAGASGTAGAGGSAGASGTAGAGGHAGAGGSAGAAGAPGGTGGQAVIERRAGVSAVALEMSRGAWGLGRPAPVLASLSIGFLALIARRNKLAAGTERDHGE